jgi:hypothetical protein
MKIARIFLNVLAMTTIFHTSAFGQTDWNQLIRDEFKYIKDLDALIKAGDTNTPTPLLVIDQGVPIYWREISKSGIFRAHCYNGISSTGDRGHQLSETNLQQIIKLMSSLPPSKNGLIPIQEQLHVCGVRSNQWFHFVYNVNNPPVEIKRIHKVIGLAY